MISIPLWPLVFGLWREFGPPLNYRTEERLAELRDCEIAQFLPVDPVSWWHSFSIGTRNFAIPQSRNFAFPPPLFCSVIIVQSVCQSPAAWAASPRTTRAT